LERALAGRGAGFVIEGEVGTGKSRLLSEIMLSARTRGLTSVHAIARGVQRSQHALAEDLLAALTQALPDEAERAGSARIPWPRAQTSDAEPSPNTTEQRMQLQERLVELF
jgi:hypothetical protein